MNICEQVFMWAYIFQFSRIHLHEKNKMVTVPEAGGGRRLLTHWNITVRETAWEETAADAGSVASVLRGSEESVLSGWDMRGEQGVKNDSFWAGEVAQR